ncbi:type II toxin-antitoxin system RelE/ParE family toxin [Burkholderia sp. Ac-20365]|uniref:type II toxin-antitoxin system RelE/ParE family toxin n=1 Tax=Burkholderia sp. Ac-20365 TaxID=2703897 RepID=UPI003217BE30
MVGRVERGGKGVGRCGYRFARRGWPASALSTSSHIFGSRSGNLRELRIQHRGRPYRVLHAFDPRRVAVLLLGGDKTGHDRWYDQNVPPRFFIGCI